MRTLMRLLTIAVLSLLLCGCGAGAVKPLNKATILDKARTAATKQELEQALGKPTEVSSLSFLGQEGERWTYKASDGTVEFYIGNGKIYGKKAH